MNYLVIELQTAGGTTAVLNYTYTDKNVAYQKYHTILAAAAVSSVEVHTALIINEYGLVEIRETFEHNAME